MHLGSPTDSTTLADGRRADIYQYEIGRAERRSAPWPCAMDVLTASFVSTPIEGVRASAIRHHHLRL
jgi:hypothetical protein